MWTQTAEGRQFIEAVSRRIVQQVDVDEIEFFDDLAAEYYQDPNPLVEKDAELGSGFEAALAAVTPAAIAAVTAVLVHVIKESSASLQEASSPLIRERIKRLFGQARQTEAEKASTGIKPRTEEVVVEQAPLAAATGEQAEGRKVQPARYQQGTGEGAPAAPSASSRAGRPSDEAPRVEAAASDSTPAAVEATPLLLTQEQLEFLKKVARREARRYGLDAEAARNLANALIAAFALA